MEAVEASTQAYADLRLALDQLKKAIEGNPTHADIAKANALYNEALGSYEAGSYDGPTAADKTVEVSSMVVTLKFGGGNGEQDVTDLIVNPTFDPERGSKDTGTIEGWITSAMNGYKQYTVSYNRAGIELHQTINGLPKGDYEVTVHTYYRAGYYDEEYALFQSAGAEATHLTTLYAKTADQTYETKVMNLFEGASPTKVADENCYQYSSGDINGWYAPDGTTPTAAWFADGRYLNTLPFRIEEEGGNVTIGLEKTEILPNDYEVVGAWHLYYLGDANAIDWSHLLQKETEETVIYNLNGQRLSAPQRGINIINGKKVLVR
jgi:tetratricopeptide (TPR) repeat protein